MLDWLTTISAIVIVCVLTACAILVLVQMPGGL